VQQIGQTHCSL